MEVLAREFRQEEEIKGIHIRKEEVELSLFIADVILYIEYPKDSTRKMLEIISEFSKLAGFKICCFLYIKNKEIKKTGPFTIPSKNKTPRNKFNQRDENTCTPKTVRY